MSEVITEAGPWRFINRTRYNSSDIAALMDRWMHTYREVLARHNVHDISFTRRCEGENDVMEIADYSPAAVWEKRKDGSHHPNFVRQPGWSASTRWKIGLVAPDKLYRNPLEALADAGGEVPKAPAAFVEQMGVIVQSIFRTNIGYGVWRAETEVRDAFDNWLQTESPLIRIEAKRQNPATSENRRSRTARTSASTTSSALIDALNDALGRHNEVFRKFSSAAQAGNRVKTPLSITLNEVQEVERQLRSMLLRAQAHKRQLEST